MKHLLTSAAVVSLLAFGTPASAELLFVTSLGGQQILTADTAPMSSHP